MRNGSRILLLTLLMSGVFLYGANARGGSRASVPEAQPDRENSNHNRFLSPAQQTKAGSQKQILPKHSNLTVRNLKPRLAASPPSSPSTGTPTIRIRTVNRPPTSTMEPALKPQLHHGPSPAVINGSYHLPTRADGKLDGVRISRRP